MALLFFIDGTGVYENIVSPESGTEEWVQLKVDYIYKLSENYDLRKPLIF